MLARGIAVTVLTLIVAGVASAQQQQRDVPASDQGATGRSISDGQRSTLVDVVQRLEQLQREVAELRGMVEEQGYQIERLKRRQRDQYLDLDRRLQQAQSQSRQPPASGTRQASVSGGADQQSGSRGETGRAVGPGRTGADRSSVSGSSSDDASAEGSSASGSPPSESSTRGSQTRQVASTERSGDGSGGPADGRATPDGGASQGSRSGGRSGAGPQVSGGPEAQAQTSGLGSRETPSGEGIGGAEDEKVAYDAVFEHLKGGRYAQAAEGFREFLQRHPSGEYADNAQYWLGESYYVTRNYEMALEAFRKLLDRYPDSAKAPDAKLKVGYTHYELENWEKARSTLETVKQQYPDSTVARLADGRLKVLRLEGH